MDKKNSVKSNPKVLIKINKASEESFSVSVKRFAKVRKIKRNIKNLHGIRMVDQVLSLPVSGRELQDDDIVETILNEKQFGGLNLTVVPGNPTKKGKMGAKKLGQLKPAAAFESIVNEVPPPSTQHNTFDAESEAAIIPQSDQMVVTTIVKLSFRDQHRRVPFELRPDGTASYSSLTELCTQFFGIKNVHRMILSYVDEDGDRVQLSSDPELGYALSHYAARSSGANVLKLLFSVKPVAAKPEEKQATIVDAVVASSAEPTSPCCEEEEEEPKKKKKKKNRDLPSVTSSDHIIISPSSPRKVKDGDVIVLKTERNGALLNLALNMKEGKVVAAREVPDVVRKNAQWIVEKVPSGKKNNNDNNNNNNTDDGQEIFFLTCKALVNNKAELQGKKNLRVLPDGQVNHQGGRGKWARFEISNSPVDGRVTLRSIGRSIGHSENNFLGIAKNNKQFLVTGDHGANSDNAKFTLKFV